jgi:hypothetical protein
MGERTPGARYKHPGNSAEERCKFEALLASRHYRLAPSTVENYDWMLNEPYDEACRKHDAARMNRVVEVLSHSDRQISHTPLLTSGGGSRS